MERCVANYIMRPLFINPKAYSLPPVSFPPSSFIPPSAFMQLSRFSLWHSSFHTSQLIIWLYWANLNFKWGVSQKTDGTKEKEQGKFCLTTLGWWRLVRQQPWVLFIILESFWIWMGVLDICLWVAKIGEIIIISEKARCWPPYSFLFISDNACLPSQTFSFCFFVFSHILLFFV